FGLREKIGHQDLVVIPYFVMALGKTDKIARNQLSSLMDQLEKGMLTVGPGFPPDNGPGLVINRLTIAVDAFAVAFHIPLLEVRRKPVHILVIRYDGLSLCSQKIIVPNPDQRQGHRNILFERGVPEMAV